MKNPSIKEGGIARFFGGIKKLFTRQSGGDALIAWVPESERNLGTKHITKNGVYKASDDGYYAYSSVIVNVSTDTGVTGAEDDGEQHYVRPNAETGELVDTLVPSSIQVVTPPTFTGPYGDEAYIGFDGMVVKAFLASGEVWEDAGHLEGVIPISELVLPVTITDYNPSGEPSQPVIPEYSDSGQYIITSYASPVNTLIAALSHNGVRAFINPEVMIVEVANYDCPCIVSVTKSQNNWLGWSPINVYLFTNYGIGDTITLGSFTRQVRISCYAGGGAKEPLNIYRTEVSTNPVSVFVGDYSGATTYKLSNLGVEYTPGVKQNIPVEWSRPGDGAVLEDIFEIIVDDITPGGHGED